MNRAAKRVRVKLRSTFIPLWLLMVIYIENADEKKEEKDRIEAGKWGLQKSPTEERSSTQPEKGNVIKAWRCRKRGWQWMKEEKGSTKISSSLEDSAVPVIQFDVMVWELLSWVSEWVQESTGFSWFRFRFRSILLCEKWKWSGGEKRECRKDKTVMWEPYL